MHISTLPVPHLDSTIHCCGGVKEAYLLFGDNNLSSHVYT